MTKKKFIQDAVIAWTPHANKAKVEDLIARAESTWQALTEAGYGDSKASKPRESKDYYAELTDEQRKGFDRFWAAYGLKKDRNGAALSWAKLGEMPDDEVQRIIDAAKHEALHRDERKGTPIFAQGWLSQRRFDDYQATQNMQRVKDPLIDLKTQLLGLRSLMDNAPSPAIQAQIEKIEAKISHEVNSRRCREL